MVTQQVSLKIVGLVSVFDGVSLMGIPLRKTAMEVVGRIVCAGKPLTLETQAQVRMRELVVDWEVMLE